MFATEKAPTSQPARVNGTQGAGAFLPRWSSISGSPSANTSVQYVKELGKLLAMPLLSNSPKLLPIGTPNLSP
jgi:hypothetical protein